MTLTESRAAFFPSRLGNMDSQDTRGLAQVLPKAVPSMADLARALGDMQIAIQSLRDENSTLKSELQKYKPRSSPWGGTLSSGKQPILQPPKFGGAFVSRPRTLALRLALRLYPH